MSETQDAPSETTPTSEGPPVATDETNPPAGDTAPAPDDPAGLDLQAMAAKHPMAEQDDPDIEITYRQRFLERALTDQERLQIGQEIAEALETAEGLEAAKKAYDADLKGQISRMQEKAATLAKALRKGTREGNVDVKIRKDWHTGSVTITRIDTGDVLEERAMTYDERQRTLLDGSQTTEAVGEPQDPEEHADVDGTDGEEPTELPEPAPGEPGSADNPLEPIVEIEPTSPVEALAQTAGKAGHA